MRKIKSSITKYTEYYDLIPLLLMLHTPQPLFTNS